MIILDCIFCVVSFCVILFYLFLGVFHLLYCFKNSLSLFDEFLKVMDIKKPKEKTEISNSFHVFYDGYGIQAYFSLVSRKLCGCYQLILFNDMSCVAVPLAVIGIKPPFRVKKDELVISHKDIHNKSFLARCSDKGLVTYMRVVDGKYDVYKVNKSNIKPYIRETIFDSEFYYDMFRLFNLPCCCEDKDNE